MKLAWACRAVPAALAALGGLLVANWLLWPVPQAQSGLRLPAEDRSGGPAKVAVDLTGFFEKGAGTALATWTGASALPTALEPNPEPAPKGAAGTISAAWPAFRGALRDGINRENIKLAHSFPNGGPPRIWQIPVGEGYAGVAVADGCAYLMDYDEEKQADVLRCLSAADGSEIWRRGYHVRIGSDHGITRTVCAVGEGCVLSMGPKCHVLCADSATGTLKWSMDLVRDWGTEVPDWYTGQNPLIDRGRAILAPAGKALLIAVDLSSGKIGWQTPNPNAWQMTHSSVMPVELGGRRLYVYCATGGVVGVDAQSGATVFELPQWKVNMANVPTPLPLPGDRLLFSGGYGAGAMMVHLEQQGDRITPKILFRLAPEVFGIEQHSPIFYRSYIYGILPRPGSRLCCLSLEGKVMWTSSGDDHFGLGPFIAADGMIMALTDRGKLVLVEASAESFKPLGQAQLFEKAIEAWGPMALSGGRLFARDLTRLACFDLREVVP